MAIRQTQAQFAYSIESVTSQALTLGFLEMVDDHRRMTRVLDELAQVTPDDVRRVAQTYLVEDRRITGWFLPTDPGGGGESAATPHWTPYHGSLAWLDGRPLRSAQRP